MKTTQQGADQRGDRVGVCVRACVYFFWGGIPLQTHGRGFQGVLFSSPLVTTGLVLLPVAHMCFWTLFRKLNSITVANDNAPGKIGFFLKLLWLYTSSL